jgi:hypothetical protein
MITGMSADPTAVLRRALLAVAMLAGLWAIVLATTGGFALSIGGVRLSSRNVRNPLLLTLLASAAAAALSRRRGTPLMRDLRWWWSMALSAHHACVRQRWVRWLGLPGAVAIGGATLLIVHWARSRPLWLDEQMIALNVRDRPFAELAGVLWLDQSAPFGWLATERAVMLLLGHGEHALRATPVTFGILTLAAAAWTAQRCLTAVAGAALVLLLSLGQWVFHYALELKHYSADTFFGLLLPALLLWVLEGNDAHLRARRVGVWWAASAVGLWWANGALFVTPACALILGFALCLLDGPRSVRPFATGGVLWLASFGVHYLVTLRFTLGNTKLHEVWSFAFPPSSATVGERLAWLGAQAAPFAARPGGTDLAILFWSVALAGVLLARPRLLGWTAALTVVSAFVLATVRLVPLYERLSLWTAPALYLATACCLDAGIRWASDRSKQRRALRTGAGAALIAAAVWLSADIVRGGWRDMADGRPRETNHQLDDRTGVGWLRAQARPGDAVLTTALALPAIWWYGNVPVSPPTSGTSFLGGGPILEVSYRPPGHECDAAALARALAGHDRALVYFGFRFDDVPAGFDDLLLRNLERIGRVRAVQQFAGVTRVAVIELARREDAAGAAGPPSSSSLRLEGCVSVQPAARW